MLFLQGGHKLGEKNSLSFPGFSRPIIILSQRLSQQKNLAIWQHLVRFLAIFSPHMHRNGHFSWHLLARVATPWHNDFIYPVNSCFKQIFDCTQIILFVINFPSGCTKFTKNCMNFSGSENSLSILDFQVCGHPVLDNTDDLLIPNTVGIEAVWSRRFSFNHAKTHTDILTAVIAFNPQKFLDQHGLVVGLKSNGTFNTI